MRPNLFIPQLCCMLRSNPRTNVPFKDSIIIVPIFSKTIHPRQSLWIENTLQNVILGVKNSVKSRIEMHLRSFQVYLNVYVTTLNEILMYTRPLKMNLEWPHVTVDPFWYSSCNCLSALESIDLMTMMTSLFELTLNLSYHFGLRKESWMLIF